MSHANKYGIKNLLEQSLQDCRNAFKCTVFIEHFSLAVKVL